MKNYKNYNIFYSLLAVFVFLLSSCSEDFLEVTPKGRLIANTTTDYDLLLNNTDFYTVDLDNLLYLGDEMAAIEPHYSGSELRVQRLFNWEDVIYQPEEDGNELVSLLSGLFTLNKIINEVMDSEQGSDLQKRQIRAEALAGRAWTYFMLINYFGKPYNASSSASDPGFPMVLEADATRTKFDRASVAEIYDLIVNDLNTAIQDLPVQITTRLRMNKPAAQGLLGKVYVFMGKFADAKPLIQEALNGAAKASIPSKLFNYKAAFSEGGEFLPINFLLGPAYPNLPFIKENIYSRQVVSSFAFGSGYTLTKATVELYDPNDLRLKFLSNTAFFEFVPYPHKMMRRIGPLAAQIGVVIPELYLLNAECKARTNDLAGAKKDLETLRENRMSDPSFAAVPTTAMASQNALIRYVIEERIREFAAKGYRWFDMRRLSVDPLFSGATYKHELYLANGDLKKTYSLKPERLTLRFPQKLMDQNPQMENNP